MMASDSKRDVRSASPPTSAQLRDEMASGRTPGQTSARDPAAAPFDTDDEAAGRPPQSAAVERALAEERVRNAQQIAHHARRSPIGPISRAALLIGLLALAGIAATWLLLAF
jgi:hypothetical protein